MRTLTIPQIEELEHGEVIPRFVGKIKKVWDQITGQGQYGQWWLQNIEVAENGHDITVTWTGEDAFVTSKCLGRTYVFECGVDKKGKPVGITRKIEAKGNKTYKGIKVDDRSKIMLFKEDEEQRAASIANLPPQLQQPANAPQPPAKTEWELKEDYWQAKDKRDIAREAREIARQPRIDRMAARRDAITFHELECSAGGTPSLDRVRQIMSLMESWISGSVSADADE